MFGQNLEVQLSSARTEDTIVVWKSFHDRSPSGSLEQGHGPGDTPEAFRLSKASCLLGCGISDTPVTLSDP